MKNMKAMWDQRYAVEDYVYGKEANAFFRTVLDEYQLKGKILLPAEGEGRNAVFAAKKGMDVHAFDISIEGKKKALRLAKEENVELSYEVGDFFEMNASRKKFDIAALIYAHLPPDILSKYHQKITELIKPGGYIILEGFSKKHMVFQKENPRAGGPRNIDMLFSVEMLKRDFSKFDSIILEEKEVDLKEGKFHQGKASVIRYLGRKRK